MGSIHVADYHRNRAYNRPVKVANGMSNGSVEGHTNGHDVQCGASGAFDIDDVDIGCKNSPTGMREDLLLAAWLIVLLRTQESGRVAFDWSYTEETKSEASQSESVMLSSERVMNGLRNTIDEVTAAISSIILPQQQKRTSKSASLVLHSTTASHGAAGEQADARLQIEIRYDHDRFSITPVRSTGNTLPFTVTRHIETLIETLRVCKSHPNMSIEESIRPTTKDLDYIWSWNHELPPTYDLCMHDIISEKAKQMPNKVAINSWDGDLTYGEVDRYSSIAAEMLQDRGVRLHDVVPACFEKSRWGIVAVLAIMKSGATFALMDPTLPLARLQDMAKQVGAKTMLTSRKQLSLSESIIPEGHPLVIEADTFERIPEAVPLPTLPAVPPAALMYIIFTSGSTGTPKGVQLSHRTYSSSAFPRAKEVGYTDKSRVLDFASYAFDVSIDSMLLTCANGGCLCIPSDEDRLNDINSAIRQMRINYAGITPSVARILEPDVIASLEILGLGGEAVSARDATIWGKEARIVIGYGPCECTIGCTINGNAATGRDYISIGRGNGAAMWIADPSDHDMLMPVGAVGELLVEGPIVGQGYLNDPEKTATVFIENPKWLVAGHKSYKGRSGCLYKTGDLGRYDPDGSGGIVFVGRKDTQVKLRGQRVELGEIESQLRARLPTDATVIVEVVVPEAASSQPTLVTFISPHSAKKHGTTDIEAIQLPDELRRKVSALNKDLAKVLPRYMIPNAYIPINLMPVLISGKTDRKRLRAFGATIDLRQLDLDNSSTDGRSLSDREMQLRQAWSKVLKIDAEKIRPDDNFFALGGNSLAAMRLVPVCRAHGLDLTVANTFNHPSLAEMAEVIGTCDVEAKSETMPFSMLSRSAEEANTEAARACGTQSDMVKDIFACTPTQESLFTFSLKSVEPYIAQRVAEIPDHVGVEAWKRAWENVIERTPMLRTRVAQLQEPGLQQIVLAENIVWQQSTDLEQYLETDRNERMQLGQSLARYAIVEDRRDGKRFMVWTVHHVLYDGWSEPIILQQVSRALQSQTPESPALMKDFVRYVRNTNDIAMQEFWRQELNGATGPQFPHLPSRDYLPTPDGLVERFIPFKVEPGFQFTLATLIRGAWALVASQYSGSDDVVFGETLSGRDISLHGVESIVGPLIATQPDRVLIQRSATVDSYLRGIQQGMLDRVPYQHMGMQNIRKVSRDAQHACEAGTGLVIQPEPEYDGTDLGFRTGDVVREALHFNPYPLMIAFGLKTDGFRACASFDKSLIATPQMERILAQLQVACGQLMHGLYQKVGEVHILPQNELDCIWQRNAIAPLSFDQSTSSFRADATVRPGSGYPAPFVRWVVDPRDSNKLSPIGCTGELWLEGDRLPDNHVDSPPWLLNGSPAHPGRNGKVHPTGDLVQQQDDGTLMFVGRKDDLTPLQGHAVNIAELEAHFSRQLPHNVRAAAAVRQFTSAEQVLVVFVEQSKANDDGVQLLSASQATILRSSTQQNTTMTVSIKVGPTILSALKRLDKYAQDNLPTHMIPSAYVIVDQLPRSNANAIDHAVLNDLASQLQDQILDDLRSGLAAAWAAEQAQDSLSPAETILRAAWAKILRIDEAKIDVDDNFFRMGGDSVLAMKLSSKLRSQGHRLTLADIFRNMRLKNAAKVMKVDLIPREDKHRYKPFSTLSTLTSGDHPELLSIVKAKLANPSWSIEDIAPVTASQALDIRGTIQMPRTSVQYTTLFFDDSVDSERLHRACKSLTSSHAILRTVFVEHESSFLQVVLTDLDLAITTQPADGDLKDYVTKLCNADAETPFELGSPFLKFLHVEGPDGRQALAIRLSHAQYDGVSLPKLLQDLETLYTGGKVQAHESFPSYIARTLSPSAQSKAIKYWQTLLSGSSLSVLDIPKPHPSDRSTFHTKPITITSRPAEITTATLLLSAWSLVLARRLQKQDITFGTLTSGRTLDTTNLDNVIGPCYQFTPVRVQFNPTWTALDLLSFVQAQIAESSQYDYLGFDAISKHCTDWNTQAQNTFFDSIAHLHDAEDFDSMPFAGTQCGVDILNPHGDAVSPLKVVIFEKGGVWQVGAVGSEGLEREVEEVLGQVCGVVEELASAEGEKLRLLAEEGDGGVSL